MSTTDQTVPRGRHDYVPRAATVGDGLRRYGRFVGLAKWLLAAVAMLLVLAVLSWPGTFTGRAGFQLDFANLPGVVDGRLVMLNPRYSGSDADGRPYVVTAEQAEQDEADQGRVTMRSLQADMTMSDGTWLSLSAETGIYDQNAQSLTLEGPIDVFSDRGYEFHGTGAAIDLAAGRAVTEQPVQGHGPFGQLRADRMTISERGQVLRFEGKVRTRLLPQRDPT